MELYDAMRTTFACREFTDDTLDDAVLYRIIDNARFAPSGGNRQAAHIIAVRNAETQGRLADLSRPGATRYVAQTLAGQSPWNPLPPEWPSDSPTVHVTENMIAPFLEPLRRAPIVLVICADLRYIAATDQYLDRVGVVGGASIYPLVWNILLSARAEGFGGTMHSMAVPQEPAVRSLLHIPDYCALAALVPLGRPARPLSRLRRKPVEQFVTQEVFYGAALRAGE